MAEKKAFDKCAHCRQAVETPLTMGLCTACYRTQPLSIDEKGIFRVGYLSAEPEADVLAKRKAAFLDTLMEMGLSSWEFYEEACVAFTEGDFGYTDAK